MNHIKNVQIEINENDNISEIIEYLKKLSKKENNIKCYRNTIIPLSSTTETEMTKK